MRKTTVKSNFFQKNGLSSVLLVMMFICLIGQFFTGLNTLNKDLAEEGIAGLTAKEYFSSGHFVQATFENWESEFLQMMIYVLLTVSLRQKGSAESKSLTDTEDVDREPQNHPKAPWPVKKGGFWLRIYNHSLSIAFALLFLISFILHFYGSYKDYNDENLNRGKVSMHWFDYLKESRFWFESLQNWQSEFLAVFSLVILSVWLREKGSPESKPVDMAHDETP